MDGLERDDPQGRDVARVELLDAPRDHPLHSTVFCTVLLMLACQSTPGAPESETGLPAPGDGPLALYVASDGWHSEIIFPRPILLHGSVPEAGDFPDAAYLSFGWGDAEFISAREPTLAMRLRAALLPTPALIRLTGLRQHPREAYPSSSVVELTIARDGFRKLIAYLDGSFERDGAMRARSVGTGLSASSLLYESTGEFHLFNTCNTWAARGLSVAGFPVQVFGIISGDDLMTEVGPLAAKGN